jgi:hypothetical protein
MNRWFRFYADAMRNPKVAQLTDKEFRLWVELLSVAADHDGAIPGLADLKNMLRRRLDHLSTGVQRLISVGLIDLLEVGFEPHNWTKFQYRSDTSTDRVRRHREKRNVSVTPPEAETEAETEEVEANASSASGENADALKPEHFVETWNALASRLALPSIRDLTPERRVRLKARIAGYSVEEFREVLSGIERSPFLRGEKGWRGCTFDWVTKKANFQKILEGNYDG